MGYINRISVGQDTHLIEPTLYIAPSLTLADETLTYIASLANFEPVIGVPIQVYFDTTNPQNAELTINSTKAEIYYAGSNIAANVLQAGHTYTLVYNSINTNNNIKNVWEVIGDLSQTIPEITLNAASMAVVTDNQSHLTTADLTTNSPTIESNETSIAFIDTISQTPTGKISATKKAIPIVSATTPGLVPQGVSAISNPDQTSLFLRQDGTWAVPQYSTLAGLGLSNALHLIGVVTEDSSYQPSDGTYGVPAIVNMQGTYTPTSGDVIIDKNNLREYVFANNVWTLLGYTASQIYDSNNIVANEVNIPTWISKITQATDGSIQVERQTIGVLPINHGGTGTDTLPTNSLLFATTTTNEGVSTQTLQSTHYINTITEDNNTYSVLGVNTNSVDTGYRLKVNGDSKFLGKVDIVTQNGNNQVTTYGNQYTPIYWHEGIPTPTALVRKINFTIAASKYGVVIQDSLFDSNSIVTQIVVNSGIEYINSPLNWSYYSNNNVSGICIELENNNSPLAANTSISGYILVSQGETSGSMTTIDLPVNNNSEPTPEPEPDPGTEPQPDPEPDPDPETPPEDNNSNT